MPTLETLRDFAAQAFGWSPAEWGRATLRYFASRQAAWLEDQRRQDFRAAVPLMAAGAKKKDVEAVFPSLRRDLSVRENMQRLEVAVGRGRKGADRAG